LSFLLPVLLSVRADSSNGFSFKGQQMNPDKVRRETTIKLTDLPNIGKAGAADLLVLGILKPDDLKGRDPYQMYRQLCEITAQKHDPCVIDVFISITRFIEGDEAKPW
jgi:hypothetical protein